MKSKRVSNLLVVVIFTTLWLACSRSADTCLATISTAVSLKNLAYGQLLQVPKNQWRECLLTIFDQSKLKSPLDFDSSYDALVQFHQANQQFSLSEISTTATAEAEMYCVRLGEVGTTQVYMIQVITGEVMEGEEYDIIFTCDGTGKLIDHLVIGVFDVLYQRNFKILDTNHFSIIEVAGREETVGPSYTAVYVIDNNGNIVLEKSEIAPVSPLKPEDLAFTESLIYLEANINPVKSFADVAFTDGMLPDTVFSTLLFNQKVIIALHINDDREQTVYVAELV